MSDPATSPDPATDGIVARLAQLDTCAVSDAADSLAIGEVAILGVTRLTTRRRLVGRLITVKLGPADADVASRHLGTTAIEAADPDTVILMAEGRSDAGGWGGLLSRAAVAQRVRGVIVDGGVRDVDEAEQLDFPVFGRNGVARTAHGRVREISTFEPVRVGAVEVATGDYVIADGSGVVIVPAAHAEQIVAAAERLADKERLIVAEIERGTPAATAIGKNYEAMLDQPNG